MINFIATPIVYHRAFLAGFLPAGPPPVDRLSFPVDNSQKICGKPPQNCGKLWRIGGRIGDERGITL
jgi:hypothetical protein